MEEKTTLQEVKEIREEIMPCAFEPKMSSRFLTKITNQKNENIVQSWVIFQTDRPSFNLEQTGIKRYNPFIIRMYDPIVPSTAQAIELAVHNQDEWNIHISILGPVGDTVEEWEIHDAKLCSVDYSTLDWRCYEEKSETHTNNLTVYHKHGPVMCITLTFDIEFARLLY